VENVTSLFRQPLSIEVTPAGAMPLRFTPKQLAEYAKTPTYGLRSLCPAGICLDVVTDAAQVTLEVEALQFVRNYCYFDLYVDDRYVTSVGEHGADPGVHRYRFDLAAASKEPQRVTIYLPHNVQLLIRDIAWSEGAKVEAVAPYARSLLCLGDSITQGMDAVHPSGTYPVLLARGLGMNLLNQGVGGYHYEADSLDPDMAAAYTPNVITVAYGTNDWGRWGSTQELSVQATDYLQRLTAINPAARVFVLTPLWRVDRDEPKTMGTYEAMVATIAEACSRFPAARLIDGSDLLPHDPGLLADKVHPTDRGFRHIADSLLRALSG
jgi:lysophospholipase L1-like esterase